MTEHIADEYEFPEIFLVIFFLDSIIMHLKFEIFYMMRKANEKSTRNFHFNSPNLKIDEKLASAAFHFFVYGKL